MFQWSRWCLVELRSQHTYRDNIKENGEFPIQGWHIKSQIKQPKKINWKEDFLIKVLARNTLKQRCITAMHVISRTLLICARSLSLKQKYTILYQLNLKTQDTRKLCLFSYQFPRKTEMWIIYMVIVFTSNTISLLPFSSQLSLGYKFYSQECGWFLFCFVF